MRRRSVRMSLNPLMTSAAAVVASVLLVGAPGSAQPGLQLIPGRNVNMVSGTTFPGGDPYLQRQNEPSVAVSSRNPMHLVAGANDYRTVDMPGLPEWRVTGDAWLGLFKSFDGGQTWQSTLLPGFSQDVSQEGLASPLRSYEAAADPTVRAGTNGMFYYSGIVFNRGAGALGAVFVSRLIDLNNKEGISFPIGKDPIRYIDTQTIDTGTAGQFIDKPWLAVDVPRNGAGTFSMSFTDEDPSENPVSIDQSFPCGNVYVTYAIFTGDTGKNLRTKVMFARSTDCGTSWNKPIMIDESWHLSQGTTMAVGPNGEIYVAWRQFKTSSDPDAIVIAKSTDYGKRFTKAIEVAQIADPFDQPTLPAAGNVDWRAFRTNAFPSMAVDNTGRVYLAWTQRQGGAAEMARIHVTSSPDGLSWQTPHPIEATAQDLKHQIMPALTFGGGKLTLLYYDFRDDLLPDLLSGYVADERGPEPPRHTVDVRVSQAIPGASPAFSESVKVSRYFSVPYLINEELNLIPLQSNPPNLPLFAAGTSPFIGDYVDIASAPGFVYGNGGWRPDTVDPTVFHAVWTENRDVVPPSPPPFTPPYDWVNYYPPGVGPCDTAGMRNQNIYSSRLTEGLFAGTMGNFKDLQPSNPDESWLEMKKSTFVIFVQNMTDSLKNYQLTLNKPDDVQASFSSEDETQLQLIVKDVRPYSSFVRTLFVTSDDPRASLTVQVSRQGDGPTQSIVLNPDPTNPPLLKELDSDETHSPFIDDFDVTEWGVILNGIRGDPSTWEFKPEILSPAMLNPAMLNPAMLNPAMLNPAMLNPAMLNPAMLNPAMLNPAMLNPAMLNPAMLNPAMLNPAMLNAPLSDITWTVTNTGNTDSGFNFAPVAAGDELPAGSKAQLLIYRPYKTPFCNGGQLDEEGMHYEILVNIANPAMLNPAMLNPAMLNTALGDDVPSFKMAPGEKVYVKLRVLDTSAGTGSAAAAYAAEGETSGSTAFDPYSVGGVVVAQAPNPEGIAWAALPFVTTQAAIEPNPVCAGGSVTITAQAIGSPPLAVQWQVNTGSGWTNISGATSTAYTFIADASMSGYQYRAAFTNPYGTVTSKAATLIVNSAPAVTIHPASKTVCQGASVSFTAEASGTPTPNVQWQMNTGSGWKDISGATSTAYTFAADASMSGSQYRAVFTNSCGTAASDAATLTVSYYSFIGFLSPLGPSRDATGNTIIYSQKSGSAVPLKWQLLDGSGQYVVFGNDELKSRLCAVALRGVVPPAGDVGCDGNNIWPYSTGSSDLRYSPMNNQYIFAWDTTGYGLGRYTIVLKVLGPNGCPLLQRWVVVELR